MHLGARPGRRRRLERLEHRIGAAAIKVGVLRRRRDGGGKVDKLAVRLVVEMQMHGLRIELLQGFEKRHVLARTARIVELPRALERGKLLHHAPDRRDADAAGDEHDVLGILDEREIVARRADLDFVADAHLVDDVTRAATARRVALDADDIFIGIGIRHDERKLPHQPVGQMQIDVGAGLIGRQLAAVGALERIKLSVARHVLNAGQTRVDEPRVRGRQVRRVRGGGRGGYGIHAMLR